MKELTVEEKAKRYDEAIERAKKFYDRELYAECNGCLVEYFFPELKESEDEKIRKAIVQLVETGEPSYILNVFGLDKEDMLAWLEKHGDKPHEEKVDEAMREIEEKAKAFSDKHKGESSDEILAQMRCEQKPTEYSLKDAADIFLDALSKTPYNNKPVTDAQVITRELLKFLSDARSYNPNALNEQKPTDKVELKFKVGDWIVYCNEDVDLITGIEESGYLINKGGYIPFTCEGVMKLWTIQDAKDGDVLALSYASRNYIQIYKRLYEKGFKTIMSVYCFYCVEEDTYYDETDSFHVMNRGEIITPSTKEQRDLLFSKMKEAGYEWDAEKKELKKIEQKPYDYESVKPQSPTPMSYGKELEKRMREACNRFFAPNTDPNRYSASELFYAGVKAERDLSIPAWSEEDEKHCCWVIKHFEQDAELYANLIDWFKSLKERCGWKPSDERNPKMIQWKGDNLREVVDFTGKSPMFDKWFKTWEEFEAYVHAHNDIFKLFDENENHYEIPVGGWIVKTPDGYNVASKAVFKPKFSWSKEDEVMLKMAIRACEQCGNEYAYYWLKSLKERYAWKPSDEQIKALEDSIEFLGCTKKVRENLKSLYEQLKKLREE